MADVKVTIAVEVGGLSKTATATASTDGNAGGLADALLDTTKRDVSRWLRYGMKDDDN